MITTEAVAPGCAISAPSPLVSLVADLRLIDLTTASATAIELLLRTPIDEAALAPLVYFVPRRYTRICVYRDDRFELLVLCWAPGARSPIHDHGGSRCFVKVQRGSLRVDDYSFADGAPATGSPRLARGASRLMNPGDLDVRSPAHDIHRVGAAGGAAISLHLYAKPLDECHVFDLASQSRRRVRNRYDIAPVERAVRP